MVSRCGSSFSTTDGALHSGGTITVVSLGGVVSRCGNHITTCTGNSSSAVVIVRAGAINRFDYSLASGADHIMLALAIRNGDLFCVPTILVNQLVQADRSITAGSGGIVAESQVGSVKAQFQTLLGCNRQFTIDQGNGIIICRILVRIQCIFILGRTDIETAGSLDGIVTIGLALCDGNSISIAGGNNAVSNLHILVVILSCQGICAGTGSVKDLASSRALLVNDQVSTGPVRRSNSDLLPSGVGLCVRLSDGQSCRNGSTIFPGGTIVGCNSNNFKIDFVITRRCIGGHFVCNHSQQIRG